MTQGKINLYPQEEFIEVIKRGATREKRSINKFCLMILEHFVKIHPEFFVPIEAEQIKKELTLESEGVIIE